MTQTGKCDTCRQRKVKCDEGKPKCGACRKKDRPCLYTYGRASAFVMQDPNQLTKHGKSKVAPVLYTLDSSENTDSSSSSRPMELRLSTQRKAEFGSGMFQTLASVSVAKSRPSKKMAVYRKKALDAHLQQLHQEASLALVRPSSAESTLIARWVEMLGLSPANSRPLSILGTWIQSIPSRIGYNSMFDLAVEFLINSHAFYWDDSYSKRQVASATKSNALKELQLAVSRNQGRNAYELVLATKMHYAAETLLGVGTMYHAIHAFGLAELLKAGRVSNVDDDHYWNLIDNAYVDDVNEAMLAGRASVYDNDYYLSTTYPPAVDSDLLRLTPTQRASMSIMHVFVQCPRLNCLVRHAMMHPEDSESIAAAVSLTECMWRVDVTAHVAELIKTSVTVSNQPPSVDLADVLAESLQFDSVQSMILCTRYWMLQNLLCGLTDTLYRHFPMEAALSLLPDMNSIRKIDTNAGICLAESLKWTESVSQKLPLVPLRLHTPLQISIGPWHRTIRHITSHISTGAAIESESDQQTFDELSRALRMRTWLIDQCNQIHEQWDVSTVDENSLYEALDSMAGEKIPEWLPTRVRFEAENGDMVIQLDYEKPSDTFQARVALNDRGISQLSELQMANNMSNANVRELQDNLNTANYFSESLSVGDIEIRGSATSRSLAPEHFLFNSGRNLCSTSGWWPASNTATMTTMPTNIETDSAFGPCVASSWWPQTPKTSVVLLDSTHKTSAFQPDTKRKTARTTMRFENRNMNGCMSPAWISISASGKSSTLSDNQ